MTAPVGLVLAITRSLVGCMAGTGRGGTTKTQTNTRTKTKQP